MSKVVVAMSGGVDSSVAAMLIKKIGYDCMGVTMKLYDKNICNADNAACGSTDDIDDAKMVCGQLGIEHEVCNFTDNFADEVIRRFIDTYESGGTPNPCVDCNRHIKFKRLYRYAEELGAEFIATGHYARVEYSEEHDRYLLKKAVNTSKDQSYVLYSLTQEQLSHTLFPLGELSKDEVRHLAEESGFANADKRDSQDICFVPDGDYAAFIERYTNKKYPKGNFVDTNGNILGEHNGIIRYTIGQRKGLGLALPEPMYVCRKSVQDNTVTLSTNAELYTSKAEACDMNLISCDRLDGDVRIKARIRYNQKEEWATVRQTGEDTFEAEFDQPQRAPAKGQSIVLYDGDTVVGGGKIV